MPKPNRKIPKPDVEPHRQPVTPVEKMIVLVTLIIVAAILWAAIGMGI